jgi:hypothetical protein
MMQIVNIFVLLWEVISSFYVNNSCYISAKRFIISYLMEICAIIFGYYDLLSISSKVLFPLIKSRMVKSKYYKVCVNPSFIMPNPILLQFIKPNNVYFVLCYYDGFYEQRV